MATEAMRIGIFYHTLEGQTGTIAERIAARLRAAGHQAEARRVEQAPASLRDFDGVIAGGSVHLRHHDKHLERFVKDHAAALREIPSALFSVSLTASVDDEEHQSAAMEIVAGFVKETGWHPDVVALFGGALKYTRYGFFKKRLMRHISKKEGGDTDMSRDYEYTDWDEVDEFADDFARHVVGSKAPTPA